jgi:hypothetical protein
MEMVKYLAMAVAIAASLLLSDLAEARGPHGCAACSGAVYYGGAPVKMATTASLAPGYVVATTPAPAPVVTTVQPAPRHYTPTYYPNNYVRRGWFSRR